MFTGAATVFTVANLEASLAHYRDALGFEITFQWGTPTFYACLCRDDVQFHLVAASATAHLPGHGSLCIFVRDVDALHAQLATTGARIAKPPQTYDYGMRDFDIHDPDGNRITFGMEASPSDLASPG